MIVKDFGVLGIPSMWWMFRWMATFVTINFILRFWLRWILDIMGSISQVSSKKMYLIFYEERGKETICTKCYPRGDFPKSSCHDWRNDLGSGIYHEAAPWSHLCEQNKGNCVYNSLGEYSRDGTTTNGHSKRSKEAEVWVMNPSHVFEFEKFWI